MVAHGNIYTVLISASGPDSKYKDYLNSSILFTSEASGNMAVFFKSPELRHHTYPACDMRRHAQSGDVMTSFLCLQATSVSEIYDVSTIRGA